MTQVMLDEFEKLLEESFSNGKTDKDKKYFNHKAIPLVKIVTKG